MQKETKASFDQRNRYQKLETSLRRDEWQMMFFSILEASVVERNRFGLNKDTNKKHILEDSGLGNDAASEMEVVGSAEGLPVRWISSSC